MLFVVAALGASVASAGTKPSITPSSIAGAKLGLKASAYKKLFGKPVRKDVLRFPTHWTRLVFTKRRIGVYLNPKGRAVVVTTWNRKDKTAEGVGPCSSIDELKTRYGDALHHDQWATFGDNDSDPSNDVVYAYTVGKLIFWLQTMHPNGPPNNHVTSVGPYSGHLNGVTSFVAGQPETSVFRCS